MVKNQKTEEKTEQKTQQPVKKAPAHRKKITFNLRFTLILLATVAVFGVGVHFLHAFQVDRNADSLLAKARQSLAEDDLDKAASYLRIYIGFRPKDARAVADLAEILDRKAKDGNQLFQAFRTYQEAIRLDPERDDLRLRSAEIALLMQRYTDTLANVKYLRKKSPKDPQLSLLAAKSYLGEDRIREATNEYFSTIEYEQSNLEAYQGLASLFANNYDDLPNHERISESVPEVLRSLFPAKRTQDSALETETEEERQQKSVDVILNEMVRLGEPKHEAYHVRAGYLIDQSKFQLAHADLAEAAKLVEADPELLRLQSQLALRQASAASDSNEEELRNQYLDQVKNYATAGLKLEEKKPDFLYLLHQRSRMNGEFADAQKSLETGIETIEDQIQSVEIEEFISLQGQKLNFQFSLAELLIDRAINADKEFRELNLKQAQKLIDQLELENLKGSRNKGVESYAEYLEGRIHTARHEWKQAIPKLERARNALGGQSQLAFRRQRIDVLLSECYEKLSNPDRQMVVYRRALEDDPLWAWPRVQLARTLTKLNRLDAALVNYQFPSLRNLPNTYLEIAKVLLQLELEKPQANRNFKSILQALQNEDQVRKQANLPESPVVDLVRAEVLWNQGKEEEARDLAASLLKKFPKTPEIITLKVNMLLQDGDLNQDQKFAKVKELIDKARENMGDVAALRSAELRAIQATNPKDAKERIETLTSDLNKFSNEEKKFLLSQSAQTNFALGNQADATNNLEQLSTDELNPLSSRLTLIEMADREGDRERVSQLLKEVKEIEGEGGPYGNVIEAQQLLRKIAESKSESENQKLDDSQIALLNRSRELLKQAKSQRISWSIPTRMLGDVERILGNEDVAIEYYRTAINQGEFNENIIKYVINYLFLKENTQAVRQIIEQVTAERPTLMSADLTRAALQLELQGEVTDKALELSNSLAEGSDRYQDLLLKSQILFARGESPEVVDASFKEALRKFPKAPNVVLAYVSYLNQVDREEDARTELEASPEYLPEDPPSLAPLTLGRGYEILGEFQNAEEQFQKALKVDPENYSTHLQLAGFYIRRSEFKKAEVHLTALANANVEIPENLRRLAQRLRIETVAYAGNYADGERALKLLEESKDQNEPFTLTDLRVKAEILRRRTTKHDLQELLKVLIAIDDRNSATVEEKLQIAKIHDQFGNWDEAKSRYESILKEQPKIQAIQIAFLDSLLKHEEIEAAKVQLEEAKKVVKSSLLLKLIEVRILKEESGLEAASEELTSYLEQDLIKTQPKEVLRDLLTINDGRVLLDYLNKEVLVAKSQEAKSMTEALVSLQKRKIEEAINSLVPVVQSEQAQKHVQAFYYRTGSKLLSDLEEYALAENLWRESIKLAPRQQDYIQLVSLLSKQNKVTEALDLAEQKLWGVISDAQAAQVTVAILRTGEPNSQEMKRAESLISQALKKSPEGILNRFLADLKDISGQHEQAILLYRQVLNENQKDIIALNNLAYLSALIGKDLKFSLDSINQAIQIQGPIGPLLDTRGVVYLKRKEYDKAISDLKRANEETPSASTLFRISQAYWESGNKIDAKLYIDKAQELGLKKKSIHPLDANDYDDYLKNFESKS